jgi:hypothetical protein
VKPADGTISAIFAHLNASKENDDCYFLEEVENCQQKNCIANPFLSDMITGIPTKADEELVDLSEDTSLRMNFDGKNLTQFWLSVQQKYSTLSTEAMKVLLPFAPSYNLGSWIFRDGRNKNQLSKQTAIVEFLTPENDSHRHGCQCCHQQKLETSTPFAHAP